MNRILLIVCGLAALTACTPYPYEVSVGNPPVPTVTTVADTTTTIAETTTTVPETTTTTIPPTTTTIPLKYQQRCNQWALGVMIRWGYTHNVQYPPAKYDGKFYLILTRGIGSGIWYDYLGRLVDRYGLPEYMNAYDYLKKVGTPLRAYPSVSPVYC